MKKGFKISIGCSLNRYKSNHLLAPFTSTPIIGTKINNRKESMKNGTTIFLSKDVSIAEIINIMKKANIVKIKCFEKKKQYALFNLSPARDEVDENEKKIPKKNNNKKPKKIFLSIFLQ